jgi:hypothetical protein
MSLGYAKIAIVLVLGGGVLFASPGPALASDGACSLREARSHVHNAERVLERAKTRLREARHVADATRTYSALYGTSVGRWVHLARRVGWPWSQMGTLLRVVDRESGGNPYAKNPVSTASGLLQFLSGWWAGKWNPFDPRQSLRHGWYAVRDGGWSPWYLTAY